MGRGSSAGNSEGQVTLPFHAQLLDAARAEGFPLVGALDIDRALTGEFPEHVGRYDRWIKDGHSGSMDYLVRGRDPRADPRIVFPEAQSILCVALPYPPQPPAGEVKYARYIGGRD